MQLIREIEAAVEGRAWVLALAGTLSLPDICAALQSPNGATTKNKYVAWVKRWLGAEYPNLDPEELYQMRCGMLHQGRTRSSKEASGETYSRAMFLGPESSVRMHNSVMGDALVMDLPRFCSDVISAVGRWEASMRDNRNYAINSGSLVRWHPDGLPPYIVGVPILS